MNPYFYEILNQMKRYSVFIFLLSLSSFLLFRPAPVIAADKQDYISKDTTINIRLADFISPNEKNQLRGDSALRALNESRNLLRFINPWLFKSGDDSTRALINFDDHDWEKIHDTVRDNESYNEIVWYRMHFNIDSALVNQPLALYIKLFGSAAELYLDGKLLKKFGVVGKDKDSEVAQFSIVPLPIPIVFNTQTDHVFALRYSNFHRAESKKSGINIGRNFEISLHHLKDELEDMQEIASAFSVMLLFAGIFITLTIVHFILYIYNRQKITNLYYSLYCFCIAFVCYYTYYILRSSDYTSISIISRAIQYLGSLLVLPLVAMLHTVFYNRLLKIFWILAAFYFGILGSVWLGFKVAANTMVGILILVAIVEIFRVIIRSIIKKRDGAWIFALALLLSPLLAFILSFFPDKVIISGIEFEFHSSAIVLSSAVLGLPLSMTLYLARDISRMGKTLRNQLLEITELSNKTIEQEQEKQLILQNQKKELEEKVFVRTQEVVQQKEVIENKNNEITESLLYAKRIQSAILPDLRLIYKTLAQSFIFYKPKDIVSGDFYSFAQKNDRVLIAAADCTGHGVAGAFMSMIGTSLLNQIINERGIVAPSQILEQLNDGIIDSLKQRESESHDGMDISLCSFDLKNRELKYAGANRPLWIIRNKELFIYKPNKFPIGGLQVYHTETFQEHTISLQLNDAVYIFSDGFADQFGGQLGKKFMTKRFKDELLSIQPLPMTVQHQHLKNVFESWKGNREQVDDILVIGIKIM